MQKTKLEIIDETIEHYKSNPRSFIMQGNTKLCVYLSNEGNKCAFSRCCTDEGVAWLHDEVDITLGGDNVGSEFLQFLKPEYQGHDVEFWLDIQDLHDVNSYWEIEMVDNVPRNKLTPLGFMKYCNLKLKYID
jgi:hypothetical protein